jgi:hypothetical protein
MAVPVMTKGDTFSAGVPRVLFDVDLPEATAPGVGLPATHAAS